MPVSTLVLSAAYTTDANRWRAFRESAAKHIPGDVHVEVLGVNESYPDMLSIQRGIDFLKGRTEEHIVLTDSYDVIVNRWDTDKVNRLIDSAPSLIMSVEHHVWPAGPWEQAYAHLAGRYPWFAINAGQYCGRRGQVITVLEEILRRWHAGEATAGGTSQEILHRMYAAGYPFTLDLSCQLFQSMLGEAAAEYVRLSGVFSMAANCRTYSTPMFLHFNGQAPGLAEWTMRLLP